MRYLDIEKRERILEQFGTEKGQNKKVLDFDTKVPTTMKFETESKYEAGQKKRFDPKVFNLIPLKLKITFIQHNVTDRNSHDTGKNG